MWSVVIFASRETCATLDATIHAAHLAAGSAPTVVVNGNDELASAIARLHDHVWKISVADKANAWNQYIAQWQPVEFAFFVDGYVEVHRGAMRMIAERMRDTGALAGSGVPTSGPSARRLRAAMIADGGLHGNLYALRGDVLSAMRDRHFRLPLGMYRTDGLIGAVCAFNLDPSRYAWSMARVAVHPDASWDTASRFSPLGALKRRMRQAQGALENLAMREHLAIQRRPPEELPATAAEAVRAWIRRNPASARRLFITSPLCYLAARRLLTADQLPAPELRMIRVDSPFTSK